MKYKLTSSIALEARDVAEANWSPLHKAYLIVFFGDGQVDEIVLDFSKAANPLINCPVVDKWLNLTIME